MSSRISGMNKPGPHAAIGDESATPGQARGSRAPRPRPSTEGLKKAPPRTIGTSAMRQFDRPPAHGTNQKPGTSFLKLDPADAEATDAKPFTSFLDVGSDSDADAAPLRSSFESDSDSDSGDTIRPARRSQTPAARLAGHGVPDITAELKFLDTELAAMGALDGRAQRKLRSTLATKLAQLIDERYKTDSRQNHRPEVYTAYANAIFKLPAELRVDPACSLAPHLEPSGIQAVPQLIPGFARSASSLPRGSDRTRMLCHLAPHLPCILDGDLRSKVVTQCLESARDFGSPMLSSKISLSMQTQLLQGLAEEIPLRPKAAQRLEAFFLVATALIQKPLLPGQPSLMRALSPDQRSRFVKTLARAIPSLGPNDRPSAFRSVIGIAEKIGLEPDSKDGIDLYRLAGTLPPDSQKEADARINQLTKGG